MNETPQFAFPFRINGVTAAEHEQDESDEVFEAAVAVLKTVKGTRDDIPAFGIPDLPFLKIPQREIVKALEKWEPRAAYRVTVQPDFYDALIKRVLVDIQGSTDV